MEWYYTEDIAHYISSSEENATCSVEPGTPEDVGIIVRLWAPFLNSCLTPGMQLQILAKTQTPFGVIGMLPFFYRLISHALVGR